VSSHAHHHPSHGVPPWLPLAPQTGIRRQRYLTTTLVALAGALIVLGTFILWALL
jgi:hypothetical protein